jgi:hypothetical protein
MCSFISGLWIWTCHFESLSCTSGCNIDIDIDDEEESNIHEVQIRVQFRSCLFALLLAVLCLGSLRILSAVFTFQLKDYTSFPADKLIVVSLSVL